MELLYELLPLPPEIVSHMVTVSNVYFCRKCNYYKCEELCTHCRRALCIECAKQCWNVKWAWEVVCCVYCKDCALLWKCHDSSYDYVCQEPVFHDNSSVCHASERSACSRCPVMHQCKWCEQQYCCRHASVALPAASLFICVTCYQRQRSKLDKKLLGEL